MNHPRLTSIGAVAAIACLLGTTAAAAPPDASPAVAGAVEHSAEGARLSLTPLGSYATGTFDTGAAEVVAHYPGAQRVMIVNADAGAVEILDVADPADPRKLYEVSAAGVTAADGSVIPAGAVANSVAVRGDGLGLAAVESPTKTDAGWLLYFDANGETPTILGAVRVGHLPDMVAVTGDGKTALVANEGEPAEDYSIDPEGTVSIVTLPKTIDDAVRGRTGGGNGLRGAVSQRQVAEADFHAFEDSVPDGVRIFGGREDAGTGTPEFPVSENLEPEYISVSPGGVTAYVSLQEANALAVLNIKSGKFTDLLPLGTVDHNNVAFDASDKDDAVNLATWPVQSFRQPDSIATFRRSGTDYTVTANEGDTRDWDGFSEEVRVKDLGDDGLAPVCASVAAEAGMGLDELTSDENLGRLKVTTADGLSDDGSCFETLYGFGGRGFSIVDGDGDLVFDSGEEFERILAEAVPEHFNSNHGETKFDARSDDKGPEPEAVALGEVDGLTYAFIGLERVGGVMVYDVTEPASSEFVTYVNNRDFSVNAEKAIDDGADPAETLAAAGDLGPESIAFISAADSSSGSPLLVVGNEVSGSTSIIEVSAR
ncbi:choice-of-anchor I family protein [Zhihengliuella halotolerans]|uniref:Choice-of-anchor I domain-containing protein n=1 Tax=Zhihengliuella halotolerans TaxID=370736 RepID=A0A4Q8AHQ3_9MICC|nr:choice-of-anchor I family protein [Zhihengliuella halotolerans]RZU63239.1 hypothetical protein EV380_2851 [Zhihengliuella halotolerans]